MKQLQFFSAADEACLCMCAHIFPRVSYLTLTITIKSLTLTLTLTLHIEIVRTKQTLYKNTNTLQCRGDVCSQAAYLEKAFSQVQMRLILEAD